MKKQLFALIIITLTFGCSDKIYFSADVRNQLIDNDVPFSKIQFYTDKPFKLSQEIKDSKIEPVDGGKISFVNGKRINILNFYSQTPCVLYKDSTEIMYLDFEAGKNKYLRFGYDRISLNYALDYNPFTKEIQFSGQTFKVISNGQVKLMIAKSTLNSINTKKRTVRGVKIK